MTQADGDPRFDLKLDPGKPLPEAIAEAIRGAIDAGELKPGVKLDNESELARRMKVARSSIRTALQRLEAQGVLQVRRGLGWYVRRAQPASPDAVTASRLGDYEDSELFEMRMGLEGLAASLAARRASDGELADIAKRNEDYRLAGEAYEASGAGDRDERLTELMLADRAFHDAIVSAAGNRLLEQSYAGVVHQLHGWRERSYRDGSVCLRSWREHAKILRYLDAHDSGGARMAMNNHLQHLYDELPELPDDAMDTMEFPREEPAWRDR